MSREGRVEIVHPEQINAALVAQSRRLADENAVLRREVDHLTLAAALAHARADRFQQRVRELYDLQANGPEDYLIELRSIVATEQAATAHIRRPS